MLSIGSCISITAQITTNEHYGKLMKERNLSGKDVSVQKEVKTFTAANKAKIMREDSINDSQPGPLRYTKRLK
ncbi:MAG: hypothetical protein FWF52_00770 [Candidatus Azobacteroides sp.]|nr:hypothetical protein [Candidatus Azobacteroides sp.]